MLGKRRILNMVMKGRAYIGKKLNEKRCVIEHFRCNGIAACCNGDFILSLYKKTGPIRKVFVGITKSITEVSLAFFFRFFQFNERGF